MRAYIIRRLLLIIPTLIILNILVFLSVRFIPGDVIDVIVGRMEYSFADVDREALERMLGFDFFATGVVQLNLLINLIYPYLDARVRYE